MREVKGEAPAALALFIRDKFGEQGFRRWLDSLPPETRKVFGAPILPGSWYPLNLVAGGAFASLCELFYGGNVKGAWEVGRFNADHGLRGVFDAFVRGGSVESLIGQSGLLLAAYYRPAPTAQTDSTKGHAVLRFVDFPELDMYTEASTAGWIEGALGILGCKDARVMITRSIAKGDTCTEWDASWK